MSHRLHRNHRSGYAPILVVPWIRRVVPGIHRHWPERPRPRKYCPSTRSSAAEAGVWDASIKTFIGGPGAELAVSKGTEVNEILPGRPVASCPSSRGSSAA